VVAGNDKFIAICAEKGSVNAERLEVAISNDCGLPKSSVVVVEVEGGPPRLPNGKVDYQTTLERAEQLLEQRLRGDSLRSEIAEIMGVGALSNADSFANLGGDSLTYVQVSFVIERRLGHLPTGWERMSIAALDDLVVSAEGKTLESERVSKAQWLTIDTDILLRALAILIVVFNHTPPVGVHELPGAMEILFVVAGQNLARFRSPSLFRGDGFGLLSSVLRHYIAPYYVILVAYMVLKRHVDVPSLLLVSTFWRQPLIEPYWFVETFFHLMVTVSVLFAFPMVRRFVSAHPLTWGWVATGILGALHVVEVETGFPLPVFLEWGALFSLGWCVYYARTTKERALLSLSSLAMPWLLTRGYGDAVVLLVMLWIPRIPIGLPAIKTVVGWCGAATFQIYLLHVIVVSALSKIAGLKGTWLYTLIAIFASAAAGVVFNALVARARSFWRQRRRPAIPAL
jgi:peptidoglycan/LPS O-acetylase OafA/YrhL